MLLPCNTETRPWPHTSFPEPGIRARPFLQSLLGAVEIIVAKLDQSQREIVLVVVGIAADGVAKNFRRFGGRRLDALRYLRASERNASSCWPAAETVLRGTKRVGVLTLAEISVRQIEFHVVGVGICTQRGLKMLNGIVVQAITREQNADAGLGAIVIRADLIKLRDGLPGVRRFAELQVSFGEQVQILRLAGMFLNLLIQFGDIELRALLAEKAASGYRDSQKDVGRDKARLRNSSRASGRRSSLSARRRV